MRPGSETGVLSEASGCARTSQVRCFKLVGSQISTYFSKGYSGCGVENRLQVPGGNGRLLLQVMSRAERNTSNSSGMGGGSKH